VYYCAIRGIYYYGNTYF
nr:immunoglobulin heavy chain junction region [Mus musculus]